MTGNSREFPARPLVGIAVLAFRGHGLLLIRRARPPLEGALSFPGGAQKLGETAEAAARREFEEETGLTVGALALTSHADVIEREAAGVRFHYTILHFAGEAGEGTLRAAGDVSEAMFVPLAGLERAGLDEKHRAAVARALRVLRTD